MAKSDAALAKSPDGNAQDHGCGFNDRFGSAFGAAAQEAQQAGGAADQRRITGICAPKYAPSHNRRGAAPVFAHTA